MQIVEKILYIRDPHQMAQALELIKIRRIEDKDFLPIRMVCKS
jgi:hypothetical protein